MDEWRRSQLVGLTILGAVVGSAFILPGHQMKRNLYNSEADCERDYSPAQCQSTSTGGHYFYHGPYYYADRGYSGAFTDPGPGRAGVASTVETSMRGGFGRFGRAMHGIS